MGERSAIEWTDATWNPVTGCSKVSPGCAHCYAEAIELRFGRSTKPWTPENAAENVKLHPERLEQPIRWRRPRMVFVNSMSDLFHELVPDGYIAGVCDVMASCPQHTFQVLTKRPERMQDFFRRVSIYADLPNVWLGTSIENRRFVDRADVLRETPAAVRFVSAEPLLGPLLVTDAPEDLNAGEARPCSRCGGEGWYARGDERFCHDCQPPDSESLDLTDIHWLIVGGESGPRHRPIRPEWVRDLRDAATLNGTAFFFKQWGGRTPKAGGRELDGRTWDEMPTRAAQLQLA